MPSSNDTPQFAMIPTQEELDQLDRDLRFFPAETTSPLTLTRAEVERYNQMGFLMPLDVLSGRRSGGAAGEV